MTQKPRGTQADLTRSIHNVALILAAQCQMLWTTTVWSHCFALPLLTQYSAPTLSEKTLIRLWLHSALKVHSPKAIAKSSKHMICLSALLHRPGS